MPVYTLLCLAFVVNEVVMTLVGPNMGLCLGDSGPV
jgi:hypothetical protein